MFPWGAGISNYGAYLAQAFILRPSMGTGLSYQGLVTDFAKDRAGAEGCTVLSYHWGAKPETDQNLETR